MNEPSLLERIASWSLAVAAVLGAVAGLLHPDDTVAGNVFAAAWRPVHYAQVLAFGLPAFGLVAAWPQLAWRGRGLAAVALVTAAVGSILAGAGAMVEATLLPVVLRSLPPVALVDVLRPGVSPVPELLAPMLGSVLVYVAGWILVGVAALRCSALPKPVGALLLAGTLLQLAPLPGIGHGLAILVHDVGLLWLASATLRRVACVARHAGTPGAQAA